MHSCSLAIEQGSRGRDPSNVGGSIECEAKESKGGSVPAVVVLNNGGTTMQWTDSGRAHCFYGTSGGGKYQVAFCAEGFYPELRDIRVKIRKPTIVRVRLRVSSNSTSGCEKIGNRLSVGHRR